MLLSNIFNIIKQELYKKINLSNHLYLFLYVHYNKNIFEN